jgi:hypothetical protein
VSSTQDVEKLPGRYHQVAGMALANHPKSGSKFSTAFLYAIRRFDYFKIFPEHSLKLF